MAAKTLFDERLELLNDWDTCQAELKRLKESMRGVHWESVGHLKIEKLESRISFLRRLLHFNTIESQLSSDN